MDQLFSTDTALKLGAGYAALQGLAQFLMMVLPPHTIAWKVSKYLTSGPARPVQDPANLR